jgi:hypothetical protein
VGTLDILALQNNRNIVRKIRREFVSCFAGSIGKQCLEMHFDFEHLLLIILLAGFGQGEITRTLVPIIKMKTNG